MDISVVVSAHNSEDKLLDCLKSVLPLDSEIIVIDHESTDKTAEVARQFTKHVFREKNNPQAIDLQKNSGFARATRSWVLSLDADERLTSQLVAEIYEILKGERPVDETGFFIPRKNTIFGKWIEHTGWYPDEQLRLFKLGKGRFEAKHVHEMLVVDGTTGHLASPIVHENFDSVSQFLLKHMVLYAPNEAEHLLDSGYVFSWTDAIRMPTGEFLSRYFARKGYLDGLHGLVLSLFMAFYHFVIFAFLWENHKFKTEEITLRSVAEEMTKTGRDTEYWIKHEKADSEKNPVMKKLKRLL